MTDAEKQLAINEIALKSMAEYTKLDRYAFLYDAAKEAHRQGVITDAEWLAMQESGG